MRGRFMYFVVALYGALMMAITIFVEFVGTDLSKFSVANYLSLQLKAPLWWSTFGIPFLAGFALIAAAALGPATERRLGKSWPFFLGCALFGLMLMVTVGGVGGLAFVGSLILLVGAVLGEFRSKPAR